MEKKSLSLINKDKCHSCGDYTGVYSYNNAKTCANCLGMDRHGVFRAIIFDRNSGKMNCPDLRRFWKDKRQK